VLRPLILGGWLDQGSAGCRAPATSQATEAIPPGRMAKPLCRHWREGIKREEQSGDARAIGSLEEVRWAILIPDELESE